MKNSFHIPFKAILLLPAMLLLLASCNEDDQHVLSLLEKAETVMEEYPDSAYRLLCEADSGIAEQSKGTRIRHFLLKTEADNKLYHPLPSDTLFQDVVNYYDGHGTANQQLMAHYLLGCIYRDRNEAPMALQCFNNAVEKADTLSQECDYTTLYKVYGQMADVYAKQFLAKKALEAERKYSHFAWLAKDTFNYIKGKELMVIHYFALCDTPQVIFVTKECEQLYKKYGYPQEAANIYHELIDIYLGASQYEKAHELMQICEKQSGLFDENGEPVKKHYYYNKGRYYAGVNQLDSAESCFRKLLAAGYEYDAYKGLLICFRKKKETDSVIKYSALCEEGLEHLLSQNQIEASIQADALYDYTRHQAIAAAKSLEAERQGNEKLGIITLGVVIIAIVLWMYLRYRKEKSRQLQQLNSDYIDAVQKRDLTDQELDALKKSYSAMKEKVLAAKEAEIDSLRRKIQKIQKAYDSLKSYQKEKALLESDIVNAFKRMSNYDIRKETPKTQDWEQLMILLEQCLPFFYYKITGEYSLKGQKLQTAVLTRLGFAPRDIAVLLDTSSQRVSNLKSELNLQMYGKKDAGSLNENFKKSESVK